MAFLCFAVAFTRTATQSNEEEKLKRGGSWGAHSAACQGKGWQSPARAQGSWSCLQLLPARASLGGGWLDEGNSCFVTSDLLIVAEKSGNKPSKSPFCPLLPTGDLVVVCHVPGHNPSKVPICN